MSCQHLFRSGGGGCIPCIPPLCPRLFRGAISVIFGSQVSLWWVHYCKRDEIYFTALVWQNDGWQNGAISRMLFSELYKIMVKKVTFVGIRGGDRPNRPPQDQTCAIGTKMTRERLVRRRYLVIFLFEANHSNSHLWRNNVNHQVYSHVTIRNYSNQATSHAAALQPFDILRLCEHGRGLDYMKNVGMRPHSRAMQDGRSAEMSFQRKYALFIFAQLFRFDRLIAWKRDCGYRCCWQRCLHVLTKCRKAGRHIQLQAWVWRVCHSRDKTVCKKYKETLCTSIYVPLWSGPRVRDKHVNK